MRHAERRSWRVSEVLRLFLGSMWAYSSPSGCSCRWLPPQPGGCQPLQRSREILPAWPCRAHKPFRSTPPTRRRMVRWAQPCPARLGRLRTCARRPQHSQNTRDLCASVCLHFLRFHVSRPCHQSSMMEPLRVLPEGAAQIYRRCGVAWSPGLRIRPTPATIAAVLRLLGLMP